MPEGFSRKRLAKYIGEFNFSWGGAIYGLVKNNHRLIVGCFTLLTIVSLCLGSQAEINSSVFKYFRQGSPVKMASDYFFKDMDGTQGPSVVLQTGTPGGAIEPEFLAKAEKFSNMVN